MQLLQRLQITLAVLLTFLFWACGHPSADLDLPNELAGVKLVRVDRNDHAQKMLSQMHHGIDFAEYQSAVGTYRDEANEFQVYVTSFKDEEQSGRMMTAMAENIKANKSSDFSYVEKLEKHGRVIHFAQSGSLANYFFQDRKRNIWITAPMARREEVLDDFLGR